MSRMILCDICEQYHESVSFCPNQLKKFERVTIEGTQKAEQYLSGITNQLPDNRDALLARIRSLEHDHKVMREALETYGDAKKWEMLEDGAWHEDLWRAHENGFDLARTALQKLEVKE